MNFGISILLILALTVVKDVCRDVNCVKCKKVDGWYYASFQSNDTLNSSKRI